MNYIVKKGNATYLHYNRIIDRNYVSSNFLIQFVLNRLLKKIAGLLKKINSMYLLTLDIGCGEGHMIEYFKQQHLVGRYVGADFNPEKIKYAATYHPAWKYLVTDVGALAFKSNAFDCILAAEMLEHLPDPVQALKEIRRVAKPGAYFIISVPNEPFFRWCNMLRGKYWNRGGRTPGHLNFWSRSEFKKMLRQHCEIKEEHIFSTFPWTLFKCKF
jgi:ubiquinone/menaquinone biosynthesis C-methylase UbiE